MPLAANWGRLRSVEVGNSGKVCFDEELGQWFKHQTHRKLKLNPAWAKIDDVIRGVSVQYRVP